MSGKTYNLTYLNIPGNSHSYLLNSRPSDPRGVWIFLRKEIPFVSVMNQTTIYWSSSPSTVTTQTAPYWLRSTQYSCLMRNCAQQLCLQSAAMYIHTTANHYTHFNLTDATSLTTFCAPVLLACCECRHNAAHHTEVLLNLAKSVWPKTQSLNSTKGGFVTSPHVHTRATEGSSMSLPVALFILCHETSHPLLLNPFLFFLLFTLRISMMI